MISNKKNNIHANAWKKYGVLFMTGALVLGTGSSFVLAKEEPRVTLNMAEDETEVSDEETVEPGIVLEVETEQKTETEKATETNAEITLNYAESETEATAESETEVSEEKETFAPIDTVDSSEQAIIATDVSGVVENFMPAMVSITNKTVQEVDTFYYGVQSYEEEGAASGIIIAQSDDELLIATNSHVVADTKDTVVWFTVDAENSDDLGVPGKIKGMDKNYELAVIAVQLSDIPKDILAQIKIAKLGSSDKLKVGQTAIAIGNGLGYGQSVTCGVISALNREIKLDNLKVPLILMDTPINFGCSGGAILNAKGQVIGITVAKEVGDASESMGYAIPIDEAIPVLENLINKETRDKLDNSNRGYLGASVVNVSDDAKLYYNMPEGAFVSEVNPDSAAEKAGIKKGDIITKFDGESVVSSDDLIDKISYYSTGETVKVEVQTAHDGEYVSREVVVTLQEGSASATEEMEDQEQDQQEKPESETDNSEEQQPNPDDWMNGQSFFEGWPFGFGFDFGNGSHY